MTPSSPLTDVSPPDSEGFYGGVRKKLLLLWKTINGCKHCFKIYIWDF